MSLKHGFTDLIADVPADAVAGKVLPSHWNAEHTFPGAGAGEVVFVDGSGHAATSAGLKYASGALTVAQVNGISNSLIAYANSALQNTSLIMADGAAAVDQAVVLACGNGALRILGDGSAAVGGAAAYFEFNAGDATPADLTSSIKLNGANFYPASDNANDFGVLDSDGMGTPLRWRTGYFGMSVVSAAYVVGASPGIDATVTTADLVGKTLTFVKGICTGYA